MYLAKWPIQKCSVWCWSVSWGNLFTILGLVLGGPSGLWGPTFDFGVPKGQIFGNFESPMLALILMVDQKFEYIPWNTPLGLSVGEKKIESFLSVLGLFGVSRFYLNVPKNHTEVLNLTKICLPWKTTHMYVSFEPYSRMSFFRTHKGPFWTKTDQNSNFLLGPPIKKFYFIDPHWNWKLWESWLVTKTIFPDRFQFIAILRIFPRISKKIQILQNPIYQGKIIIFDVLDM